MIIEAEPIINSTKIIRTTMMVLTTIGCKAAQLRSLRLSSQPPIDRTAIRAHEEELARERDGEVARESNWQTSRDAMEA